MSSTKATPRPIETPRDHLSGDQKSSLAILEYGDYGCPDCRRLQQVLRQVRDESGLPLKYVFRHLPVVSSGPHKFARAIAAEAAARQNLFWEMHDALFRHAGESDVESAIQAAANDAGLDITKFELDRADPLLVDEIQQDIDEARAHGIEHVPSLFIRGNEYLGAWDVESVEHAIKPPLAGRVNRLALEFSRWAASSAVVLIIATILALLWRNSPFGAAYEHLWHIDAGITFAASAIEMSLHHWVNDLLMAVFFLVVGLELKRELLEGELANPKNALLPVGAAVGGMAIPAAVYLAFNWGTPNSTGWGVPMATDIAFAIGVMALAGPSVPTSLRVFLTALAIADDLGAILILALAYNHGLSWDALGYAAGLMVVLIGFNRARIYSLWPYLCVGLLLWIAVFQSGLHATLAGVLLAATIPARRRPTLLPLLAQGSVALSQSLSRLQDDDSLEAEERKRMNARVQALSLRLNPPAAALEHALQPWSAYFVLPIFALANAGVVLSLESVSLGDPLMWGIVAGLLIGKPIGICGAVWLLNRFAGMPKPASTTWRQLFGASMLCGIGFTMSIFIANEAFATNAQLDVAKLAILSASVIAAMLGYYLLRGSKPQDPPSELL